MIKLKVSAFDLAQRFVGMEEIPGTENNMSILAMLRLDQKWPKDDEVPWCSAFVNYVAWLLRLPRSKSLRARSWLNVGMPVGLDLAWPGFDVVILKRGGGDQPGPEIIEAPGHVGFYAGKDQDGVFLLGGNQKNSVNVAKFKLDRILGTRRLEL